MCSTDICECLFYSYVSPLAVCPRLEHGVDEEFQKPARRKRRRSLATTNQPESRTGTSSNGGIPSTVRALMGSDAKILPPFNFVKKYAPNLPDFEPLGETPDHTRLQDTLVCPSESMRPSYCRGVECIKPRGTLWLRKIWHKRTIFDLAFNCDREFSAHT